MSQGEFEAIEALRALFSARSAAVQLGIGDDAAVLLGDLVVSVDAQVEHVHFERAWLDLEAIGYRAFVSALSDLAAMGAVPIAALSSLVLPAAELVSGLTRGQASAALEYACPVVGGNLARGTELSITTTVLGRAARPLLRGGARPGDTLFVVGELGAAAAGLRAHQQGRELARVRDSWARPVARIPAGLAAATWATAGIDVSDGLTQDAAQVARASGVGVDLSRAALEPFVTALAEEARVLDADAWDWVLRGGEDYALLVTGRKTADGFVPIGRIVEGHEVTLDGVIVTTSGHDHFR